MGKILPFTGLWHSAPVPKDSNKRKKISHKTRLTPKEVKLPKAVKELLLELTTK